MSTFFYKARDESGKPISGIMEAANKDILASKLQKLKYTVISITEKAVPFSIDKYLQKFGRVKLNDLVMFNVQLASMISSGISLPTSLLTLLDQIENETLKSAVSDVYDKIKEGQTFSDALKKHPGIFPNLFTNMIRAGEVSGNLDEILTRLATFAEHEQELKQRISTAMFYPMILAVVGILVVIGIIVSILPSFAKMFIESNVPLPMPTMVLYNTNIFIRAYWKHAIVVLTGLYFLFRWYKKTPAGKYSIDNMMLNMPMIGKLIRQATIARLTRTLASLISAGVPILQSLEVTEQTIDNAIISKVLKNVYSSVSKGESISAPLRESGQFPAMTVHMIAVGEEAGTLDAMLNKVADFYDMSTDYSVKKLTALLEPIFL
ncbi:MAG: type II secretion system F family protein, partial [bacterium]